jgi:hypothetical protein
LTPDSIQQKYAQTVVSTRIVPGCVQFLAAKKRFYTAWVNNGPRGPETPLPVRPDERTSPDRPGWYHTPNISSRLSSLPDLIRRFGSETRIEQQPNDAHRWYHRAEKRQPFAAEISGKKIDAGGLARPVHAVDQPRTHRILTNNKYQRNGNACRLCGLRGRIASGSHQSKRLTEKVGGKRRSLIVITLCPAIFNDNAPPLYKAISSSPRRKAFV